MHARSWICHQMLKIAGKPSLVIVDEKYISAYNDWNLNVLDMVLDFYYIRA